MKYYLITNVATLQQTEWAQQYPYHMVLAQVLKQDREYFQLVKDMIAKGCQVILDNGAHEGVVCNLSEYLKIAAQLQPWCVVLPDLIGASAIESRSRSLTFLSWWQRLAGFDTHLSRLMYVPQGRCQREIVDEYLWATEYFRTFKEDSVIIGLGNGYKYCYQEPNEDAEFVKTRLLKNMLKENFASVLPIHILGGRTKPTEFYSTIKRVIGIDSCNPCKCALQGEHYPVKLNNLEKATKQPFDFTSSQVADRTSLRENILSFCAAYGVTNDAGNVT